jgi:hypothetical protein
MSKLSEIQLKLKAPKNQFNKFGNFNYRSQEDILEAVKPLLGDCQLYLSDEIKAVGELIFVEATATFIDGDKEIKVKASAGHPLQRKGMDLSQVTGASSSYARKYALNGLFLIDDNKDADTNEDKLNSENNKNLANFESAIDEMNKVTNITDCEKVWNKWKEFHKNQYFIAATKNKKQQLQK